MTTDNIKEIGIDEKERLFVMPQTEQFEFIYRDASGVGWDDKGRFLYSPKLKDMTYFDCYRQILLATKGEYGCELKVRSETDWTNIPNELKDQICGQ
ncbi:hypothetical protein [Lunatibacter salilacus]|uniref:hypothetical protein n=1 Tax=Lunatibacter salilacus TaxID=2483804 RepID=UPI00131B5452|nr:hypothetical protein [Lunatibacter salilacus]HSI75523.1 hypothetical protein [Lunatimonas sp.]